MNFFGSEENMEGRSLAIYYRPCVPSAANSDCLVTNVTDKAAMDQHLEAAKEYLGEAVIQIYLN